MADREQRLRVLIEAKRKDLIHNDLANSAFYLKERVIARDAAGDREGIFLDMMAAATMTAFALEAYLNFVGTTKVPDWKDRAGIRAKLDSLRAFLKIDAPLDVRPYATVGELIELRNTLAHGKPRISKIREVAEGTYDELHARMRPPQPDWEKSLTPEFVVRVYEDVEAIWREMLNAAGIDILDTATVIGPYGMELLGLADGSDRFATPEGFDGGACEV